MSKLRRLTACLALVSLFSMPAAAQPGATPSEAASCETCHGAGGNSNQRDVPRLNGQQRDYILLRLKQFMDPTRGTPHANKMMWLNAAISDADAVTLADYFSRQMPPRRAGRQDAAALAGGEIYSNGAPPDIAACATCHGRDGDGLGAAPRIAGQHQDYLQSQLEAFMLTARAASPMNRYVWDMTSEQMRQVSAYLSNN